MFVFSAAALAFAACGHPGGSGGSGTGGSSGNGTGGSSGDCTPGTEACACLSGNTCLNGLTCADDVNKCTAVDAGSTSGTGGTTPGTGGSNPGTGGTTSGTGGSNPGTGGTTPGTGGSSPGTGGSTGGGTNLVINGDFSQGATGWSIGLGTPASAGVNNGQYCVTLNSGSSQVILGWGDSSVSTSVTAGVNYTLSYQASTTSPLSAYDIHIGEAVTPYTLDADVGTDNLQSGMMTFTHTFMIMTSGDSQAGVAFLLTAGNSNSTVCFDNVSLTQN